MGIVTTDDKNYVNIANAIRGKTGKTGLLLPPQMASEISNITSGGEAIENEQYIRPMEWLALPERDESRDQIFILVAIYEDTNLPITINTTGECTVSWGDINDTVVTGSANEFTFTWDNVSPDSLFDLWGYRQSLIKIECDKDLLTNLNVTSDLDIKEFIIYAKNPKLIIDGKCLVNIESYELYFRNEVLNPALPPFGQNFAGRATYLKNIVLNNVVRNSGYWTFYPYQKEYGSLLNEPKVKFTETVTDFRTYLSSQKRIKVLGDYILPNVDRAEGAFSNMNSLIKIGKVQFGNNVTMSSLFKNCLSLKEVDSVDTSTSNNLNNFVNGCTSLKKLKISVKNATTLSSLASNCKNLVNVEITDDEDKKESVNFYSAFSACENLEKISFNPLICNNVSRLFTGCYSLRYIENANFANATVASELLSNCKSLIFVKNLNLEKSTNNSNAFFRCNNLKIITFAKNECIKSTISFGECTNLSSEMLNYIFETGLADLTGQDTQTITIKGCGGASECDVTIAQSKNWTVVR